VKNLADKLSAKSLKLPLYPTPELIERARKVMGTIDFDPTADPVQQVLVEATSVPAPDANPLTMRWHGNVWVSPKGAVKNTRMWLTKTLQEYRNGHINSFVFFTSASELLRATPVLWDYPMCIPYKRVKQLRATKNGFEAVSPSTWNFLCYGPPVDQALDQTDRITLFYNEFRDIGRVIYNEYAGDNWSKDLHFIENKGRE